MPSLPQDTRAYSGDPADRGGVRERLLIGLGTLTAAGAGDATLTFNVPNEVEQLRIFAADPSALLDFVAGITVDGQPVDIGESPGIPSVSIEINATNGFDAIPGYVLRPMRGTTIRRQVLITGTFSGAGSCTFFALADYPAN